MTLTGERCAVRFDILYYYFPTARIDVGIQKYADLSNVVCAFLTDQMMPNPFEQAIKIIRLQISFPSNRERYDTSGEVANLLQ